MTYRNKLLLKRVLLISGIVLLVIVVALLIGFTYLGRYVVYTENGAYFSFRAPDTAVEEEETLLAQPPENPVLVTGESIYENDALGETDNRLLPQDVQGMMIRYEALYDGLELTSIEFGEETNTVMLEMRKRGSDILNTPAVQSLITRAKNEELHLVALMSCLDDSEYALAHQQEALPISGGALWVDENGSYFLDPTNPNVQKYLIDMIAQLADMGFDEVVLDHFYFPTTSYVVYDTGDSSRDQLLEDAFETIQEAIGLRCTLGIMVNNPSEGHQAFDLAEHLYVCFDSGSQLKQYTENHPDYYIVYVTASHDTRFDDYGKIEIQDMSAQEIAEMVMDNQEE